jgi:hypothetical protein
VSFPTRRSKRSYCQIHHLFASGGRIERVTERWGMGRGGVCRRRGGTMPGKTSRRSRAVAAAAAAMVSLASSVLRGIGKETAGFVIVVNE